MKDRLLILAMLLGSLFIGFSMWVYIYNAEAGLFIIPEEPLTFADNVMRLSQIFSSSVLFAVWLSYKEGICDLLYKV